MERWTVGMLEDYSATEQQPSNRPTFQHSVRSLSVSRLRNRSLRPFELASRLGHHGTRRIRENQMLKMRNGFAAVPFADQQPRPVELRRRRRRTLTTGAHDFVEQSDRRHVVFTVQMSGD